VTRVPPPQPDAAVENQTYLLIAEQERRLYLVLGYSTKPAILANYFENVTVGEY
jgi:hypothetical protein